jgi:putative transcriptional regulator
MAKMTQKELSEKTGIRPATVSALYHESFKVIDKNQLNEICKIFNCQPGDIIEYIPDDKK